MVDLFMHRDLTEQVKKIADADEEGDGAGDDYQDDGDIMKNTAGEGADDEMVDDEEQEEEQAETKEWTLFEW